jgi:Brp/Blh family beta-carotene 15,15'-monooxygenase
MNHPTYILFLGLSVLLLVLSMLGVDMGSPSFQLGGLALIAILGIPHGALDHVIAGHHRTYRPVVFFIAYLIIMGLVMAVWLLLPTMGLFLLLLSSAYHFGQSQFSDVHFTSRIQGTVQYLSWGIALLSGLIYLRSEELTGLLISFEDTLVLQSWLAPGLHGTLAVIALAIAMGSMFFSTLRKELSITRFLKECAIVVLLILDFSFLPIIAAFGLYFCILHSYRVMTEEFSSLKDSGLVKTRGDFVRICAPLTLVSLIAIAVVWWSSAQGWLPLSPLMLVFVLTSVITLPHGMSMEYFYSLRSAKSPSMEGPQDFLGT